MKKLSLALVAAVLIGCGSEGDKTTDKAPLEVQARRGAVIITSLEDGLRIHSVVVNRGNCGTSWNFYSKDLGYRFWFRMRKDKKSVEVSNLKDIQKSETLSLEDFYDKYGTDKRLEINFGDKGVFGADCDPLETQIETNKGTWSFSFR